MQKITLIFIVGILFAFNSAKSYGQSCSLSGHKIESTGDFKGLVILVGFSDMPFTVPVFPMCLHLGTLF